MFLFAYPPPVHPGPPEEDLIKKISCWVKKIVDTMNHILVEKMSLLIGGLSKTG